jgi:hypothetical protein
MEMRWQAQRDTALGGPVAVVTTGGVPLLVKRPADVASDYWEKLEYFSQAVSF